MDREGPLRGGRPQRCGAGPGLLERAPRGGTLIDRGGDSRNRLGWPLRAAAAALALAGASCLVNPATGKRELMVISEGQEQHLGRQADRQVREEQGMYAELAGLRPYVASVGAKVAARSARAQLEYHFEIVDAPEINAFAIPGGYVYITRGLMARMNSEDELAAVLGHEIAHIAARHSAAQLSKALAAQVGLLGIALFTDPRYAEQMNQAAGLAVTLAMQGYSREDEREADDLGLRYAKRAGYNPRGAIDLMHTLARLQGREPSLVESWFASHPATSERIANVSRELSEMRANSSKALARPIRRDEYLQQIDGLRIGLANDHARVIGRRYVNVKHDYSLEIPEGWSASLRGADLLLARPSEGYRGELKVETTLRPGVSGDIALEYAREASKQRLEVLGPVTKAGLPAGEGAIVVLRGQDSQGRSAIVRKMFLVRFDRQYVLTFVVPEERREATEQTFRILTGSIKFLRPGEEASFPEQRLSLYRAQPGDTWASIAAARIGSAARPGDLASFNGFDRGEEVEAGLLLKVAPTLAPE